jgi:hypothetical protein
MSYQDTDDNTLRAPIADADPLTKAWGLELLRVCNLTKRESWEEVLLDLTEQLEPTMKKIAEQNELNEYDKRLIHVLQLLVLPNLHDSQTDRNMAVTLFAESRRRLQDRP